MQVGRQYKGVGPLRTTTFSYNPVNTTLGTPIYLPTAEPAGDDFSYTIAAGHLPDITGSPLKYTLCAAVVQSGFNESASARNVSYRFLINDASILTGSYNATANQFWVWSHFNTLDIKVGDKVSCRVWSTDQASDIYWDYQGLYVMITRLFGLNAQGVCKELVFPAVEATLLSGMSQAINVASRIYHGAGTTVGAYRTPATSTATGFTFFKQHSLYGFFQAGRGDNSITSDGRSGATRAMGTTTVPSSISYRPVGDL